MQQAGTLRKRKRRPITKVKGLCTASYNDGDEGALESSSVGPGRNHRSSYYPNLGSSPETSVAMNTDVFASSRIKSATTRVTRDPDFHQHIMFIADEEDYPPESPNNYEPFQPSSSNNSARPLFLDEATLRRLRILIYLGNLCGAFPWTWCSDSHTVKKWSPPIYSFWSKIYSVFIVQTVCLLGFQVYSFYHQYNLSSHEHHRETFMSSHNVIWYAGAVYYNVNMMLYRDRIRNYINVMLAFNEKNVSKYLIHLDGHKDGGRGIIKVAFTTNITQIFISILFFVKMPFLPFYLFSYIHPKSWYWLIPGAIQQFVVVSHVITSFLLVAWLVVAHCNTVNFWLTEIHNHNDSDYTLDQLRHPQVAMETYKSLQVLCGLFNDSVAPMGIPCVKTTVFTALIPYWYVLIRSINYHFVEEFPGILTYPVGVLDCSNVGFGLLTLAAQMHDLAGSCVDSWKVSQNKDFKRLLMSLPCLKVQVGRFYFITVSTTITFFKSVFDYVVSAIMTFP